MTQLTQHTIKTPYMIGPVHCYTGVFSDELVLFDTGPPTVQAKEYLLENIDLEQLKHVLVTHCHIDHYGLAHWLEREYGATIYLPRKDCLKIQESTRRLAEMYFLLEGLGFSPDYLQELKEIFDSGALFPPQPEKYRVAEEELPGYLDIGVLPCPGHSQSDLVYTGDTWAVTGDTLLRGVFQSPILDVDLELGGRYNNYAAYCQSLISLAALGDKTILPGHRYEIESIETTLVFYLTKLLERVAKLHQYLAEPDLLSLVDKLLQGRMTDVFHIYLKVSEILFMKDFLTQPCVLQESLVQAGMFEKLSEPFAAAVAGQSIQAAVVTG